MKYKYYIVMIIVHKNEQVAPQVLPIRAASQDEAIKFAIASNNVINYLMQGYRIGNSLAAEIESTVCPYNANTSFVYKWDDNNKLTELFIDLTQVTPEFYNDLKQVLLKHWSKDTDKL